MRKKAQVSIQLQSLQQQLETLEDMEDKGLQNVMRLLRHGSFVQQTKNSSLISRMPTLYISPMGGFALFYNLLYLILFYMIQIHISLGLTFGPDYLSKGMSSTGYNTFYQLLLCFLALDIFVTFNKGYHNYGKGKIQTDHGKIIRRYLKFQFILDILVVLFLVIPQIDNNPLHQYIQFIPLVLLWVKKLRNQQQIVHIVQYHKKRRIWFILFILALDVLMIGHYGACAFIKIDLVLLGNGFYGDDITYYWIADYPFQYSLTDVPWYVQYIFSQSFSTGTLSTLAPGPTPRNPIQVVFSLAVTLSFVIITAYVAEVLIEILETQQQKRIDYQGNIQVFNRFMRWKKVPDKLKTKINNEFQIIWELRQKKLVRQQGKSIGLLPSSLRDDLLLQMSFLTNMQILGLFKNAKLLLYELSTKIKRNIYNAQTFVFHQTELTQFHRQQNYQSSESVFYLNSGVLKYYLTIDPLMQISRNNQKTATYFNKIKTQGKHPKRKQYTFALSNVDRFVGLYEFITNQAFWCSCKTIDLCEIDTITRKQFRDTLKLTDNQQRYHRLKYEVLVQNELNLISKVCSICLQGSHIQSKCPRINTSKRVGRDMLANYGNIGVDQKRNSKFNRDSHGFQQTKYYSIRKVYNKSSSLIIKEKQTMQQNLFRSPLYGGIKLDQLLFKIAKIDQLDQCYLWLDFYPEFNLDQANNTNSKNM